MEKYSKDQEILNGKNNIIKPPKIFLETMTSSTARVLFFINTVAFIIGFSIDLAASVRYIPLLLLSTLYSLLSTLFSISLLDIFSVIVFILTFFKLYS